MYDIEIASGVGGMTSLLSRMMKIWSAETAHGAYNIMSKRKLKNKMYIFGIQEECIYNGIMAVSSSWDECKTIVTGRSQAPICVGNRAELIQMVVDHCTPSVLSLATTLQIDGVVAIFCYLKRTGLSISLRDQQHHLYDANLLAGAQAQLGADALVESACPPAVMALARRRVGKSTGTQTHHPPPRTNQHHTRAYADRAIGHMGPQRPLC